MYESANKSMWNGDRQQPAEADLTDVQKVKQYRRSGDDLVQQIKSLPPSRETSLAITNIQQGIMWLGMELKRMGEANPYPSNKDPNTGDTIEPTADGLKF